MEQSYIKQSVNCCKNCTYVTYYKNYSKKFECAGILVKPNGICDKFSRDVTPREIMRRIDKRLKELENVPEGKYKIQEVPNYHQNYRELTDAEVLR